MESGERWHGSTFDAHFTFYEAQCGQKHFIIIMHIVGAHMPTLICTQTHTHCIYNPHSYTHACMYRHETFGILIWYEIKLFEQLVESLLCQALPGATAFCFMINHALTLCVCVSVITELKNSMYREKRLIMMVWRGTPGAGVQSRGGMDRTCGWT